MAVPKKRTSKSKKNSRKANWVYKGHILFNKYFSVSKSNLQTKIKILISKKKKLGF